MIIERIKHKFLTIIYFVLKNEKGKNLNILIKQIFENYGKINNLVKKTILLKLQEKTSSQDLFIFFLKDCKTFPFKKEEELI